MGRGEIKKKSRGKFAQRMVGSRDMLPEKVIEPDAAVTFRKQLDKCE